ncbi:MAG: hypothetical protein JSR91_16405 [Proteobacteria bacterium]|nr:hypothetical protein [Pseudomonadota bacterium]
MGTDEEIRQGRCFVVGPLAIGKESLASEECCRAANRLAREHRCGEDVIQLFDPIEMNRDLAVDD